jgi:hypothetical protein
MTIYIKDYTEDEGRFRGEISGYFANLEVDGEPKICLVAGDADCLTVGELINACGYTCKSIVGRRILITIEDEERSKA